MKLIALAVLFFGSACGKVSKDQVNSTTVDFEDLDLEDAFNKYLKPACDKVGAEDAYNKFVEAAESTMNCLKTHLPNLKNETESLCVYHKNNIRECMTKMIDFLEYCSRPEEKYFPQFALDVLNNIVELLCVDNKTKGFDREEAVSCITTVIMEGDVFTVCDKNQVEIWKKQDDEVVNKLELCNGLRAFGKCFNKYLNEKCPKEIQFRIFISQILNAVEGPCHK